MDRKQQQRQRQLSQKKLPQAGGAGGNKDDKDRKGVLEVTVRAALNARGVNLEGREWERVGVVYKDRQENGSYRCH